MNKKYIGFDIRLLPLFGVLSLLVPAIVLRQYRWADLLGLAALLVLCVFWTLSTYQVWVDDNKDWDGERAKLQGLIDALALLENVS